MDADLIALQIALREHDERQLYSARRTLHDVRTMYAVLTDIIQKNITKVILSTSLPHSNLTYIFLPARFDVLKATTLHRYIEYLAYPNSGCKSSTPHFLR